MSIENMINKVKQEVKHDVESIKSMSHLPKPTISAAPFGPYDPSDQPDPSEPSDDREHLHEKRKSIDNHVHKKIIEVSDRFHKHLPIFESAGYKLKKFEVELGISPKTIPHFMIDESVTLEQKMEALEKVKGKRMMHLMMEALIKASKQTAWNSAGRRSGFLRNRSTPVGDTDGSIAVWQRVELPAVFLLL